MNYLSLCRRTKSQQFKNRYSNIYS